MAEVNQWFMGATSRRAEVKESVFASDLMAAGVCCAALLVCILIAHPFVNSAFNDDWSYSWVPYRLAKTGRFEYGGWGSPTVIFQSVWAALFAKLFGFSFDLLRAVTIPFSMGFILLTYFLARKVGLQRNLSQFAALTIAVSPLFLPLAASFMTEPYGCFFSILCVYAAICSAEAEDARSASVWMWVVALGGILGGSDRQTVWLAPLVLLPYLGWLRRANQRFMVQCALAYVLCLLSLAVVLAKFSPKYGPTEISKSQWISLLILNGRDGSHYVVSVLLVSALMCLPVLLCYRPMWKTLGIRQIGILLLICFVIFDYLRSGFGLLLGIAPFLGNIITPHGVIDAESGGLGTRPLLLRVTVRYAITLFLLFAAGAWILLARNANKWKALSKTASSVFVLFVLPYMALLIPGALLGFCYDRYSLPLLPLFLIGFLLPLQGTEVRIPISAWACLLVFASYGVVTTHDHTRNLEARSVAATQCVERGISPLRISAGLERDGWLQLLSSGKVGTLLYGVDSGGKYNQFWFWYYSRAIKPDYVALSSELNSVPKKTILAVPFTTWAPYSKQAIYVVRREDIPTPKLNSQN